MKNVEFFKLWAVGLALTCLVATGCKKGPTTITPLPGARSVAPQGPGPERMIPGDRTAPGPEVTSSTTSGFPQGPGHPGWNEDREMFKSDTVYFDFDSAVVKSGEKSKIEAVATYLKSNPDKAVKVEGHCDERGTEEYNRALGDRRALAVREQLIGLGIAPERVDTISYGKDLPADPGHTEAAWKANRRGVFLLLSPPK